MIIDIFPFFNELDLLEARLNILKDVVDLTIILEAEITHSGKKKPMYYTNNASRYRGFNIAHVVIPASGMFLSGGVWEREAYQRNYAMQALEGMSDNDYILFSDVDEIPRPESVVDAVTNHPDALCKFKQGFYYYYLNGHISNDWCGTVGFKYSRIKDTGNLNAMRVSGQPNTVVLPDAGWNFSYLGGPVKIVEKIEAICHREVDTPEFKNLKHLTDKIAAGDDIYNRNQKVTYVPIDGTYPQHILDNLEKYKDYIHA